MKNKRVLALAGVLVFAVIIIGHFIQRNVKISQPVNAVIQRDNNENSIVNTDKSNNEVKQKDNVTSTTAKTNSFMQLLSKGKVDGLEFGIGSDYKDIVSKMGKPKEIGTIEGSVYICYDNMDFLFPYDYSKLNATSTDQDYVKIENTTGKVITINIRENIAFSGVKVGMTVGEIEKILGAPSSEMHNMEDDVWDIIYLSGDYQLIFSSKEKNGATSYATLRKT